MKAFENLGKCAREQWYLLTIKAKFASKNILFTFYINSIIHLDGQYMAHRLSKAIH